MFEQTLDRLCDTMWICLIQKVVRYIKIIQKYTQLNFK